MFPCQSTTDSDFYDSEKATKYLAVWLMVCLMSVFTKNNYEKKFYDPLFQGFGQRLQGEDT